MPSYVRDSTASLLINGYAWLPDLRRRSEGAPVRTRLLGKPVIALHGPEAVGFFYDEQHVRRSGALPGPVLDTLFGRGAVHTLDGEAHRVRKAMFMSRLTDADGVAALVERVRAEWKHHLTGRQGREIVLFDEAALVLSRAVCAWAGIPLSDAQTRHMAEDAVAMVDGFATPGPRHLRARRARTRQEETLRRLVEDERAAHGATGPSGPTGLAGAAAGHGLPDDETASGPVMEAVTWHREANGALLDPHTAAVELLNVVRPTVAIAWFVTFAAHAMHRWPEHRERLREGDSSYAEAFAHEVRRFYPFTPFTGGLAAGELEWDGETIPAGAVVLLDVYGQNHDPDLWPAPYRFDPGRFVGSAPSRDELIPQGGGDAHTGHRCPGEDITVAVLAALATELAQLDFTVPRQDLRISLRRIPARPRSGFRLVL